MKQVCKIRELHRPHRHFWAGGAPLNKIDRRTATDTMMSSPGYLSQSQYPGNSPSEEVRGHWKPTGHGPKDIQYKLKSPHDNKPARPDEVEFAIAIASSSVLNLKQLKTNEEKLTS